MQTATVRMRVLLGVLVVAVASASACQCDPGLTAARGLVISPPSLDFGYVLLDDQSVKTLHISNGGAASANLTRATISGDHDFTVEGFAATTLVSGASMDLKIAFTPTVLGNAKAQLVLQVGTSANAVVQVDLTGVGVTTSLGDGGVDGGTDGGADGGADGGVDGGTDGGVVTTGVGCADGTREGFVDQQTYPSIAGCSGAWSVPGLGLTAAGIQAACNRQGGNDSAHADGQGCSALDLCAPGWHICQGLAEVKALAGSCAGAVPASTPAPGLFFAVAQHSCTNTICDQAGATCTIAGAPAGAADNDNDVFGCSGPSGTGAHLGAGLSAANACAPLNSVFACEQSDSLCWNQAMPSIGPWQAAGSNSYDESDYVTKDGCQGNSCAYSGNPIGPSDEGGVLCCAGP